MTTHLRPLSVALSLAIALAATPVSADPVAVTSGHLTVTGTMGVFELFGEDGLEFSGRVSAFSGVFNPWSQCTSVPECPAGTEVSLRAFWSGFDIRSGVISFEGRTYPVSEATGASTSLEFAGSFVTPPIGPSAVVTAPFQLVPFTPTTSGSGFMFPFPDLETQALAGFGTATITLSPFSSPDFPGRWSVDSVRYEFSAAEPVPEPATMLLVGLGMAGVARKYGRSRSAR